MRKTFRKRIDVSKLRQEGIAKSSVVLHVYGERAIDEVSKAMFEFFDRYIGRQKNGEHTN